MTRKDRQRQALHWWCSPAPHGRHWTPGDIAQAKLALARMLATERPCPVLRQYFGA